MKADLHTHSIYSDGRHTPDEMAEFALQSGVKILSVTDHDNMDGDLEKRLAAESRGIIYIPGWEISAYDDCKVHITGYNCDRESDAYLKFMEERKVGSYIRAEDVIKKLSCAGIHITIADAEKFHSIPSSPIHTMHIARAIAEKGYTKDEYEAYMKYLGRGRVANSGLFRPTPYSAVEVIHASGGIASLAHPGRIELDVSEKEKLLARLKEVGLDGIEAVYTTHTEADTRLFKSWAEKYSLLVTGGSDTHIQGFASTYVGKPEFHPDEKLLSALGISTHI